MTEFFLDQNLIYDSIQLKDRKIYKTIILNKERDIIFNTSHNQKRIESLIDQINQMNQSPSFIHYQYEIVNQPHEYQFIVESDYLLTLNEYINIYGFRKEYVDILVDDICQALDEIDGHGHLCMNNIYRKNGHYILGDIQFYNIKYKDDIYIDKKKDIYDFLKILYKIVSQECKENICSLFFQKGLSQNKDECYQTTQELRYHYQKYFQ